MYPNNMLRRNICIYISILISIFTAYLCSNLTSLSHGYINKTSVKLGDFVGYSCSYGYRLVGQSTRQCVANCNGNQCRLSGEKPSCVGRLMYYYTCIEMSISRTIVSTVGLKQFKEFFDKHRL